MTTTISLLLYLLIAINDILFENILYIEFCLNKIEVIQHNIIIKKKQQMYKNPYIDAFWQLNSTEKNFFFPQITDIIVFELNNIDEGYLLNFFNNFFFLEEDKTNLLNTIQLNKEYFNLEFSILHCLDIIFYYNLNLETYVFDIEKFFNFKNDFNKDFLIIWLNQDLNLTSFIEHVATGVYDRLMFFKKLRNEITEIIFFETTMLTLKQSLWCQLFFFEDSIELTDYFKPIFKKFSKITYKEVYLKNLNVFFN